MAKTTTRVNEKISEPSNEKQKQFCEEFIIDFNGTQAAIRAGYSKKTANEQASRLLANVSIQSYIKELIENRKQRTRITQDEVVEKIIEVMNRCMQAKPVVFMGHQVKDSDGNNLWKFDSQGANKALDMLMKHTGGYKEDNKQQQININPVVKYITPDKIKRMDDIIDDALEQ